MTRKRPLKPSSRMTTSELAEQTAEFDQEFIADTFRPMTAADRRRWERIRQKGRASNKKSADAVTAVRVALEPGLLRRADALAEKLGVTRASLIARGLKAVMAAQGEL
jgi:hypothetical protein